MSLNVAAISQLVPPWIFFPLWREKFDTGVNFVKLMFRIHRVCLRSLHFLNFREVQP